MARRRKTTDPPDSVAWSSYPPQQSKYWLYDGPWVPVDQIPAATAFNPANIRPHEKPLVRLKSVSDMLTEAQANLTKIIAYYVDLDERGVDALPWEWAKEKIREGRCDPAEPNALHYAFCNAYGDIARLKAQIPAYEAVIKGIEPETLPLFHWNG